MRILILVALALLTAGQARASGSPIDLDPASLARKIFKRKPPEPRDPVSRNVLIQQEREYLRQQLTALAMDALQAWKTAP